MYKRQVIDRGADMETYGDILKLFARSIDVFELPGAKDSEVWSLVEKEWKEEVWPFKERSEEFALGYLEDIGVEREDPRYEEWLAGKFND